VKVPVISGKELISILKKHGFSKERQRGDHVRLVKATHKKIYKVTVPLHDPLKKKTLLSILEAAGMTLNDLKRKK